MERVESIKKIGWYHLFVLKALLKEPTHSLSTKELALLLQKEFSEHGIKIKSSESSRVYFCQKIKLLLDLELIHCLKGAINLYSINPAYLTDIEFHVRGYYGFFLKKKILEEK